MSAQGPLELLEAPQSLQGLAAVIAYVLPRAEAGSLLTLEIEGPGRSFRIHARVKAQIGFQAHIPAQVRWQAPYTAALIPLTNSSNLPLRIRAFALTGNTSSSATLVVPAFSQATLSLPLWAPGAYRIELKAIPLAPPHLPVTPPPPLKGFLLAQGSFEGLSGSLQTTLGALSGADLELSGNVRGALVALFGASSGTFFVSVQRGPWGLTASPAGLNLGFLHDPVAYQLSLLSGGTPSLQAALSLPLGPGSLGLEQSYAIASSPSLSQNLSYTSPYGSADLWFTLGAPGPSGLAIESPSFSGVQAALRLDDQGPQGTLLYAPPNLPWAASLTVSARGVSFGLGASQEIGGGLFSLGLLASPGLVESSLSAASPPLTWAGGSGQLGLGLQFSNLQLAGASLEGTWSQGPFALTLVLGHSSGVPLSASFQGTWAWQGALIGLHLSAAQSLGLALSAALPVRLPIAPPPPPPPPAPTTGTVRLELLPPPGASLPAHGELLLESDSGHQVHLPAVSGLELRLPPQRYRLVPIASSFPSLWRAAPVSFQVQVGVYSQVTLAFQEVLPPPPPPTPSLKVEVESFGGGLPPASLPQITVFAPQAPPGAQVILATAAGHHPLLALAPSEPGRYQARFPAPQRAGVYPLVAELVWKGQLLSQRVFDLVVSPQAGWAELELPFALRQGSSLNLELQLLLPARRVVVEVPGHSLALRLNDPLGLDWSGTLILEQPGWVHLKVRIFLQNGEERTLERLLEVVPQ